MRKFVIGCLLLAASSLVSASTTYTATGTAGGVTIDANAIFTFSANQLTLTLSDLLANPTSVAQNLSGFEFTIGTATGTLSTTAPPSAPSTVSVSQGGNFVVTNSPVNPGWSFSSAGGVFTLNGLTGTQAPSYTIIGPPGGPKYSQAGPSIAGSGPFNGPGPNNPFINQTATWVFDIPGVTSSTLATNVMFSFGTTPDQGDFEFTPEPSSLILMGGGLGLLALLRRRILSFIS